MTPVGGRPVHMLCIKLVIYSDYKSDLSSLLF